MYHSQHFSEGHLTSYEVLLLNAPYTAFSCCSNFNPATFLLSVTSKAQHECLTTPDSFWWTVENLGQWYWLLITHWWFLFKRGQWQILCWVYNCKSFWYGWGSIITYGHFGSTGWIICFSCGCTLVESKTARFHTDSIYIQSSWWFWNIVEATCLPYFRQKKIR